MLPLLHLFSRLDPSVVVVLEVIVAVAVITSIVGVCMSAMTTVGGFVVGAAMLHRRIKHENLRHELDKARLEEIRARQTTN